MYNSQNSPIKDFVERADWEGLTTYLSRLSHGEMRRAEKEVRESVLPALDNNRFWAAYRFFVLYKPQAFLPCIINIHHLAQDDTLDYDTPDVKAIADLLSKENVRKLVGIAVPHLRTEAQINGLFVAMHISEIAIIAKVLLKEGTPLCYYLLFKTLKQHGEDKDLIHQVYRLLLRRGDDLSFNMASILRTYFGLDEAPGRLSLRIEHYELSHLETSFDNFSYVLQGRRPKLI